MKRTEAESAGAQRSVEERRGNAVEKSGDIEWRRVERKWSGEELRSGEEWINEVERKRERERERRERGDSFIGAGPHELCCEWLVLSSTRMLHVFAFGFVASVMLRLRVGDSQQTIFCCRCRCRCCCCCRCDCWYYSCCYYYWYCCCHYCYYSVGIRRSPPSHLKRTTPQIPLRNVPGPRPQHTEESQSKSTPGDPRDPNEIDCGEP